MLRRLFALTFVLLLPLLTGGCGTYVPEISEFWEGTTSPVLSAGGLLEYRVKRKVYCDIIEAISKQDQLPKNWAVQVTLDLQVDEVGALNPGVSFIKPLPNTQSFTLGGGGTLSAQSTREDKFGSYWALDKLLKGGLPGNPCDDQSPSVGSSLLLEADLGITEWLTDSLQTENFLPSSALTGKADSTFKQDYLSYHIKFIIISNGNITPTWKLVRLSTGNGSLPLASASRTRTHDLLITFGPAFKPTGANLAFTSHAAQEFGIAVSNGNRTVLSPLINP
jgi:hypothetical protein